MKPKDIRKEKLRLWVREHGTPVKEKSYFSQLVNPDTPFGEKAARRLEEQYDMGEGYLDVPIPESRQIGLAAQPGDTIKAGQIDTSGVIQLITLYGKSTKAGREFILDSAKSAQKIVSGTKCRTADN